VAKGAPQLPERCLMRGQLRGVDAVPVGSQGCLASDVVLGGRHLRVDGVEPVQQSLRVRFELRVRVLLLLCLFGQLQLQRVQPALDLQELRVVP
jgi:hypothetical protein